MFYRPIADKLRGDNMKSKVGAIAALGLSFTSLAGTNGPVKVIDLGPTTTLDVTGYSALIDHGELATDLGTLGGPTSQAVGINDKGLIVGFADTARGQPHAVLWREVNGTWIATDINSLINPTSGWTIDFAYGINNRGIIEAVGRNADEVEHTLLLGFKTVRVSDRYLSHSDEYLPE